MEEEECCTICAEPTKYTALFPCDHSCMCPKCLLTLSNCYNQRNCPICQKQFENDPIITDKKQPLKYDDEIKDETLKHDEKLKIFYKEEAVLEQMQSYLKYQCPECGTFFTNKRAFTTHLNTHGLHICQTCYRAGRFLNIDVPIFTNKEMKIHSKQHPTCPVCPFVAFDAHELSVHMTDTHIRCNICAKHDRIIWFATMEDFVAHNRERHYPCEHAECLAKGLAFDSSIELQMHQITAHGKKIASISTPKEFNENDDDDRRAEKREQRKRHMEFCKKLALKANSLFKGDKDRVGELLKTIDLIDEGKISPKQFLSTYHSLCADLSEALFTDTVSAIGDARMRSYVVRLQDGYRIGKPRNRDYPSLNTVEFTKSPSTSRAEQKKPEEDFPSLDATYATSKPPKPAPTSARQTPQNRRGATKFQRNGGWASVKITTSTPKTRGRGH